MKNRPYLIGVTGGIGAGKSIVCEVFSTLGIPVYNADDRAKKLMNTDPDLKEKIIRLFGEKSYLPEGTLNRRLIAKQAFQNKHLLEELNGIVHPVVALDFEHCVEEHQTEHYLIKEAAIMFESDASKSLDKVINVDADENIRIKRVLDRDPQRTIDQVQNIISNQMSSDQRNKLADYIITNNPDTAILPQILELHQLFIGFQKDH